MFLKSRKYFSISFEAFGLYTKLTHNDMLRVNYVTNASRYAVEARFVSCNRRPGFSYSPDGVAYLDS